MQTPLGLIVAAAMSATVFSPLGPANAASFNCMELGSMNAAEQRVCRNRSLGALDERLDSWYRRALVRASYFDQTDEVRGAQRAWLRERNSCGARYWCLRRKYVSRLRELKSYVEHV